MLIRKDNEIEIWTDTVPKGTGKECLIIALLGAIFFLFFLLIMNVDFSIIETYYLLIMLLSPCILIFICGCIFITKENNKKLIAKVNDKYVILYKKNNEKQINIEQITKINKISSSLGSFIIIFYKNENKEEKYSFEVSCANKNLLAIAIHEYNNKIIVN